MIKITLPDGGVREYDASQITPMEIAKSLSNSLPKKAVAAKGGRRSEGSFDGARSGR